MPNQFKHFPDRRKIENLLDGAFLDIGSREGEGISFWKRRMQWGCWICGRLYAADGKNIRSLWINFDTLYPSVAQVETAVALLMVGLTRDLDGLVYPHPMAQSIIAKRKRLASKLETSNQ